MTGPATPQSGRPSSQELVDDLAVLRSRASFGHYSPYTSKEVEAALDRVAARLQTTEQALRDCVQAIEDFYGGAAFVPEESFEAEAAEAGRRALEGAAE